MISMAKSSLAAVAVVGLTTLSAACGGGSGSTSESNTISVPGTPFEMSGASATIGNVTADMDKALGLLTLKFDVTVTNNSDATDAFDVSVNVVKPDNTAAGFGTMVVSDFIDPGQSKTKGGVLQNPGPFPSGDKLVVTKIDANSALIPGQ